MYTTIGFQDVTDFISPNSEDNGSDASGGISFSASLSDPASTWDFVVDDINQTLNIQNFMPVIVFDENQTLAGNAIVPAMNFLLNPVLGVSGGQISAWTAGGTLPGAVWTYTNQAPKLTVNNNTNAQYTLQSQNLVQLQPTFSQGYVVPGQQYMLSIYMNGSGTITGFQSLLELIFLDINGNTLSPTFIDQRTPLLGKNRITISGTAPAGAFSAQLSFGGITTSGTNSGAITFTAAQFEPMWFVNKGVSYPTPDCNFNQIDSVIMPDGTYSRKCRLFAGYVEDHVNHYVGKQRHTEVKCAAASKILETSGYISASYTSTQDTSIITDAKVLLPSNSGMLGLFATGKQNTFAASSTLVAGIVIDSISFTNANMREVLNGVSAQSGSIYFVDPYYYLWYVPPSFSGTVTYLSDNPDNVTSFPYDAFSIEYDSTNPVNTALVVGSKQKAAAITDTFSGDGVTTVFNLTEPPDNVQTVTVGGTSQRTGVDGVDNAKFGPSSTFKALINKQNQTIKFATAPANVANNTVVTYTYEDQVVSQVLAADAIAQQRTQFWGLVSDSNITSTTAAKNRGLKELTDYAFPRTILTLSSLGIYMPVGSLIFFTCASEGMTNQPFVVQTVDSDLQGGGVYHWNYTAGVYNPSLLDHFRNVHKAVKKTPTTANVAVIASIDVAIFDSFSFADSVAVNNNGAPSSGPYVYGASYNDVMKLITPLRWYKLKETTVTLGSTITDYGSQAQNGTVSGGGGLSSVTGIIPNLSDTAIQFFRGNYISLPTTGLPTGASAWTVGCWFEYPSLSGNYESLMSIGHSVANAHSVVDLFFDPSVNKLAVGFDSSDDIYATSVISSGTAYFVVVTYDGTTVKVFWNGSQQASGARTLNLSYGVFEIGNDDINLRFSGVEQEAFLLNYALSAGAISTLYNTGLSTVVGAIYGFSVYS